MKWKAWLVNNDKVFFIFIAVASLCGLIIGWELFPEKYELQEWVKDILRLKK